MACFGFCREMSENNNTIGDIEEDDLVKTGSLTKNKKKYSWMTRRPVLQPKKSAAKSVSVDISVPDPTSKLHSFKLDEKNFVLSKEHKQDAIKVNASNTTYKKMLGTVKEIILESSEINQLTSLAKDHKYKKLSIWTRLIKRKGSSKISSPPEIKSMNHDNRVDPASIPPPKPKKPKVMKIPENINNNVIHVKNQSRENSGSIAGMSIIIVILVITLFWGKLCAILCTAACLYMVPMLRRRDNSNVNTNNGPDNGVLDVNSDEHKKKVVLEGLLQRDRRSFIGIS